MPKILGVTSPPPEHALKAAIASQVHTLATLRQRFSAVLPNHNHNAFEDGAVFPHFSKFLQVQLFLPDPFARETNCLLQSLNLSVSISSCCAARTCFYSGLFEPTQQHLEDIKQHYPRFSLVFGADLRNQRLHALDRLAKCQRRMTVGFARDLFFVTQAECLSSEKTKGPWVPWLVSFSFDVLSAKHMFYFIAGGNKWAGSVVSVALSLLSILCRHWLLLLRITLGGNSGNPPKLGACFPSVPSHITRIGYCSVHSLLAVILHGTSAAGRYTAEGPLLASPVVSPSSLVQGQLPGHPARKATGFDIYIYYIINIYIYI